VESGPWRRGKAASLHCYVQETSSACAAASVQLTYFAQVLSMSTFRKWFKENLAGLLVAILGVGGAFLGAYYGSDTQLRLWQKEKQYTSYRETIDKRVKIVETIVKSHVQAQRVSAIVSVVKTNADFLSYRLQKCANDQSDAICSKEIKPLFDSVEGLKQVAELQAEYFANLVLAGLYFCEKTRNAISEMEKTKQNWWDIDEATRDDLVRSMASEVTCGVDFKTVLQ
jgi:hypothetical protein